MTLGWHIILGETRVYELPSKESRISSQYLQVIKWNAGATMFRIMFSMIKLVYVKDKGGQRSIGCDQGRHTESFELVAQST